MNLAHIKFLSLMIIALCKLQTVCYEKLCYGFESSAHEKSCLRRIQRFMAHYTLDVDLIARLLFALLPDKPPYVLAMDRTNWKFGTLNINILVIAITYQGVAFPILYKLLPKAGNSNTQERIDILERYIQLFGKETIGELLADREFVGERWLGYLNRQQIAYYLRIRNNFWAFDPRKQEQIKVSWLFTDLELNQNKALPKIYYLNKQLCYIAGAKIKNKQGKEELQIIVSFTKPELAVENYKQRWQIESAFRALKTSGFNIEATHLTDIERINKLLAIVIIAFAWAYKVGIYLHTVLIPIKIKTHGRKAKSIFKYGLEYIAAILLNPFKIDRIDIVKFLSCTYDVISKDKMQIYGTVHTHPSGSMPSTWTYVGGGDLLFAGSQTPNKAVYVFRIGRENTRADQEGAVAFIISGVPKDNTYSSYKENYDSYAIDKKDLDINNLFSGKISLRNYTITNKINDLRKK